MSRKPSRREGRVVSAEPVGLTAHLRNPFSAVTMGAASTRPSLRPRIFGEGETPAKLGRNAPRDRGVVASWLFDN